MRINGFVLIFFPLLILPISISAQESHLFKGCIFNGQGCPITGAVVSCIELPDSTIIAYSTTDAEGNFQIQGFNLKYENAVLEVSFLGYEKLYVKPESGVMRISLRESDEALDEVKVTVYVPELKQKPGKFVYKPRLAEVKGLDSYDLLRFTPLMTLNDNSVSILGKGTSVIYINGRKPVMDNASLMEMLRSTPASQIENIEIITSPNSSHKASITGGIVNIIMKKNPNRGLTGSASVSGKYLGERVSPRATLYLGYSKDKFNASANLSCFYNNTFNLMDATYNYRDTFTDIINSTTQESKGHYLNGNINFTYDFTKRSTTGVSFHMGGVDGKSLSNTNTLNYMNGVMNSYSTSRNETFNPSKKPKMGVVAFYNLKTDDNGSNLDLSANWSTSLSSSVGNVEYAKGTDPSNVIPYLQFQQNSKVNSFGYEFKASYNHYFDDDSYLEAGYEFNASQLDNDFVRNGFNGSEYVRDDTQSNNFIYNERVNALYLSYDRIWGDIFSATVGVRAENTDIKGNQVTTDETFHINYWNFFPQISVLLNLADGDHSLALDYSRGLSRPFYNDLNPFKIWTSENTYTMGNIHIKPMIYNDVDLSYTIYGDYVVGAYYSYGTDSINEYTYAADNNTTVSSVANFGDEHILSMYFNMSQSFFMEGWRMIFDASVEYEDVDGMIGNQNVSYTNWTWNVGVRNILQISKQRGVRATVSYNYYTPIRGILKIGRHKHLLSVSVNKNFKFGGSLNIDAANLLNYKPAYFYDMDTYSYNYQPMTNNILVQVRYTYKFGQNKVKGAKNRSKTNFFSRFN